ncbi:MAG TPA: hypothetical protein VGK67_07215 [Myxococcales bacterium]
MVWGVADLHAHPASHLGFGSGPEGAGLFWGHPGGALDQAPATIAVDLQRCDACTHSSHTYDVVRIETRKRILAQLDQLGHQAHGPGGWPGFENWPTPADVFHQEMHVTWIRRAYDGGLRLMIASATDNQLLSMLWNRKITAPAPRPDKQLELESVRAQLAFLRELASRNASWMSVVRTAAEARAAIEGNRLALILSVEMDSLDADDILALKRDFDVRQVVPIHLANNAFGGVALYSDVFNSANQFLNGHFYEAKEDAALQFRLQRPLKLTSAALGVVDVKPIGDDEYRQLGYQGTGAEPEPGHRNPQGLSNGGGDVAKLLRAGLLVDLAHMSQASQEATLSLAADQGCPVMNSHAGLRGASGDSERWMRVEDARRMGELGGVFGLGTDPGEYGRLLLHAEGEPLARLTTSKNSHVLSLERRPAITADLPATNLVIVVETGDDDLRGGQDNALAELQLRNGFRYRLELNGTQRWAKQSVHEVEWRLPAGLVVGDLASFGIKTTNQGGINGDVWDVRSLTVDVESTPTSPRKRLLDLRGNPWRRFSGVHPEWTTKLRTPDPIADEDPVGYLRVLIGVGRDGLGPNSRARAEVQILDKPSVVVDLNGGLPWVPQATYQRIVELPPGTTRGDLVSLKIAADLAGGLMADTWDIADVRVEVVEDPVARWLAAYREAVAVLGTDGSVALGTDMNGFAFQIPFCAKPIAYPFRMPASLSRDPAHPIEMGRQRVGDKEFDFHHDGLSTYGLLPDFLFALSELAKKDTEQAEAFAKLFQSAEAVIRMWEAVEAAAAATSPT